MNELEETMDKLENEVIENMGENPMRAYKLQFPYTVRFRLTEDDKRTELTISTISEEMTFARSRKDALLQKERNDAISKDGYTRHIVNWVQERMCKPYFFETCELAYTGTADVLEMSDEELYEYERQVISDAE
mgnify:FL=1